MLRTVVGHLDTLLTPLFSISFGFGDNHYDVVEFYFPRALSSTLQSNSLEEGLGKAVRNFDRSSDTSVRGWTFRLVPSTHSTE